MRRTDKEIKESGSIDRIIAQAQVCRLGLARENTPYIVPVSFGYDGKYIYFHSALEGMKIDFLLANPKVCFELEHEVNVVPNDTSPCNWTFSFYSIIGFGTVEEISDIETKTDGLNQIMKHYSGREWDFNEQQLKKIRVWRIAVEQITGKQSKDKSMT